MCCFKPRSLWDALTSATGNGTAHFTEEQTEAQRGEGLAQAHSQWYCQASDSLPGAAGPAHPPPRVTGRAPRRHSLSILRSV